MSEFSITIEGTSGLIMHSADAMLDSNSEVNLEIARIAASRKKTPVEEARLGLLEVQNSLWLNEQMQPEVPVRAIRRSLEGAARKTKDGGRVREGLVVTASTLTYPEELGSSIEDLCKNTMFRAVVVVQRNRLVRCRALFPCPWSVKFLVDTDPEQVTKEHLAEWVTVAGQRVGLGDWRPEKSGSYGRFRLGSIDEVNL